jgi:hypothetical protein
MVAILGGSFNKQIFCSAQVERLESKESRYNIRIQIEHFINDYFNLKPVTEFELFFQKDVVILKNENWKLQKTNNRWERVKNGKTELLSKEFKISEDLAILMERVRLISLDHFSNNNLVDSGLSQNPVNSIEEEPLQNIVELEQKLADIAREKEGVAENLCEANLRYEHLFLTHTKLEKTFQEVKAGLEIKEKEFQAVRDGCCELREKQETLTLTKQKLEEKLEVKKQKLTGIATEKERLAENLCEANLRYEHLFLTHTKLEKTLQEVKAGLEIKERELQAVRDGCCELREKQETLILTKQKLEEKLEVTEQKLTGIATEKVLLEKKLEELLIVSDQLFDEKEVLLIENRSLYEELKKKNQLLEELSKNSHTNQDKHQNSVAEYTLNEFLEEKTTWIQTEESARRRFLELAEQYEKLQEIRDLDIIKMESELKFLREEFLQGQDLKKTVRNLEVDLQCAKEDVSRFEQLAEYFRNYKNREIEELHKKAREKTLEMESLRENNEQLEGEIQLLDSQNRQLEERNTALLETTRESRMNNQALSEENSQLQSELDKAIFYGVALNTAFIQSQEMLNNLKKGKIQSF